MPRRRAITAWSLSPQIVPETSLPWRSLTLYAYVSANVVTLHRDACRHRCIGTPHEPVELLRVVALLQGELVGDLARPDQPGQRGVHGGHAVAPSRLHHRVDLVHLPLPDEVPDRGGRHEHLAPHHAPPAVGGLQELLR